MTHQFTCHQCGKEKQFISETTTGFALDEDENKICFDCCGFNDARDLKELEPGKQMLLYLNTNTKEISNWPGSFTFVVPIIRTTQHSVPCKKATRYINRYDTWFKYEGNNYHGVQYGDNTTIVHIRKLKNH